MEFRSTGDINFLFQVRRQVHLGMLSKTADKSSSSHVLSLSLCRCAPWTRSILPRICRCWRGAFSHNLQDRRPHLQRSALIHLCRRISLDEEHPRTEFCAAGGGHPRISALDRRLPFKHPPFNNQSFVPHLFHFASIPSLQHRCFLQIIKHMLLGTGGIILIIISFRLNLHNFATSFRSMPLRSFSPLLLLHHQSITTIPLLQYNYQAYMAD